MQGVVTGFALKATNRDQSLYEIVLESRLALLRQAPNCRFFLDMTVPEIIEQILREHEFNKIFAGFEFTLHRTYRKRSFVMQWGEDDLAFITDCAAVRASGSYLKRASAANWCALATTMGTTDAIPGA